MHIYNPGVPLRFAGKIWTISFTRKNASTHAGFLEGIYLEGGSALELPRPRGDRYAARDRNRVDLATVVTTVRKWLLIKRMDNLRGILSCDSVISHHLLPLIFLTYSPDLRIAQRSRYG